MQINNSKLRYDFKIITQTSQYLFIYASYVFGVIIALNFVRNSDFGISHKYIENMFTSIFSFGSNFRYIINLIFNQLIREFIFIWLALFSAYSVIPKTLYCVISVIKGAATAVAIRCILQFDSEDVFSKITSILFLVVASIFLLNYVVTGLRMSDKSDILSTKKEIRILFSSQSINCTHEAITACGSIILLFILKSFLLFLISLT